MKKKFLFTGTVLLLLFLYLSLRLPSSLPVQLSAPPAYEKILLVPLDSRPVCSSMVQKLGRIACLDVILPPKELLDNYQQPAAKEKLLLWLRNNAASYPAAIISSDMLLHGGLLQSRQHAADDAEQDKLLQALEKINAAPTGQTAVFSVIPRLLVSDELLPDSWYQFHLMRYAQLLDMAEISNDYSLTQQMLEYKEAVPDEILQKYLRLFRQSEKFNIKLLAADARMHTLTVIGQDDASPFGLPHRSALALEKYIEQKQLPQAQLTYGADEIAALLLARCYLQQKSWHPKVFLHYATPTAEFKHMPYMAVSTGAALRSQLELLGAAASERMEDADIVCYISCGDEDELPAAKQAEEIRELLQSGARVALIDSSANFEAQELLLPQLLLADVAVNRLTAYAAWNTFSNSSGTALAQAILFTGRLQELEKQHAEAEKIAALYAQNLNFTTERILEDYCYQKLIHSDLREKLLSYGIPPTDLQPEDKLRTECMIQARLSLYAELLLRRNLGRTPFCTQNGVSYFLRDCKVGAQLPWQRIFEVRLHVSTHAGTAT